MGQQFLTHFGFHALTFIRSPSETTEASEVDCQSGDEDEATVDEVQIVGDETLLSVRLSPQ